LKNLKTKLALGKSMQWRSVLIFIALFFLLILRFYEQQNLRIYRELKPNSNLKIYGKIKKVDLQKKGLILQIDKYFIKTQENQNFLPGERVRVVGRPEVRVISGFFKQIWLINPEIIKFNQLTASEQKKFSHGVFYFPFPFEQLLIFAAFFRNKAMELYPKILPEPQASLLSGLVLGESLNFEPQLWQGLKETGTLHLVAASGMNVTLVTKTALNFLINFLTRRLAYFVTLVFILIYCLLAGGSASVVRAGLMAALGFLGLAFGRETKGGWLLFLAAVFMLLVEPWLLFEVSFQLSFSAMAGIIWLRPMLEKLFHLTLKILILSLSAKAGKNLGINLVIQRPLLSENLKNFIDKFLPLQNSILNTLLDTLSAQLATFPFLYFTFGQLQPLAFLPNLMVIPTVAILTMIGFIILISGLIFLPLAFPLAWLAWPLLTYFIEVIKWWERLI
jgi:ComEC/Rec2-related protein